MRSENSVVKVSVKIMVSWDIGLIFFKSILQLTNDNSQSKKNIAAHGIKDKWQKGKQNNL